MTINHEVIRKFHEANQAYRLKLAEALSRDELVTLPQDVREARAALECQEEIGRLTVALIAYEQEKRKLEDRMVVAHETLGAMEQVAYGGAQ